MDTLVAHIDTEVTAALKAEAERYAHVGMKFDKDEVEIIAEHVWEYYVANISDNPARPIYELQMGDRSFEDVVDSYREDRLSSYYATMIG